MATAQLESLVPSGFVSGAYTLLRRGERVVAMPPLKTTHLQKRASSMQNSIGGAEFRTLGPVASIGLKQKIPGVPAGAVGCRIQDPGTRGYRW